MKNLILIVATMVSFSAMAANITCADIGASSYPVSKDALKLTKHLKVSTCDGKQFKMAVKSLKQTIKSVPASAKMVADTQKAKDTKLSGKVSKKLSGFNF